MKESVDWDNGIIANCLELLQTCTVKQAALKMGVGYHPLRMALARRGYVFKHIISNKKRQGAHKRAFVVAENPMGPFNAMAAMERDKGGCRWLIGDIDSPAIRFCGAEIKRGSMCAGHGSIAYIKPDRTIEDWLADYDAWETELRKNERQRRAREALKKCKQNHK